MLSKDRRNVTKGSWRWAVQVAEITAWGTAALVLGILHIADLSSDVYRVALAVTGLLGLWLLVFFRLLLRASTRRRWFGWAGVGMNIAFACGLYGLLRGEVPGIQLI